MLLKQSMAQTMADVSSRSSSSGGSTVKYDVVKSIGGSGQNYDEAEDDTGIPNVDLETQPAITIDLGILSGDDPARAATDDGVNAANKAQDDAAINAQDNQASENSKAPPAVAKPALGLRGAAEAGPRIKKRGGAEEHI
jgi:hypothetical protein